MNIPSCSRKTSNKTKQYTQQYNTGFYFGREKVFHCRHISIPPPIPPLFDIPHTRTQSFILPLSDLPIRLIVCVSDVCGALLPRGRCLRRGLVQNYTHLVFKDPSLPPPPFMKLPTRRCWTADCFTVIELLIQIRRNECFTGISPFIRMAFYSVRFHPSSHVCGAFQQIGTQMEKKLLPPSITYR
jgi:hypothetical protein